MQPAVIRILLFTLLILSLHQATSQPKKEFYFQHIKTEDGLSNSAVNDILKDKKGFLWIATLNGLNCFDGSHFKVWKADPGKNEQLINGSIYGLCEDADGNIWCAHNAGVSRYNRSNNTFTNYNLVNSVTGKRSMGTSNVILTTRKGQTVTYSLFGVFIYDKTTDKFIQHAELKPEGRMDCEGIFGRSFLEDPVKNGIWIGTSNGLKYFDLDTKIFYSHKNNPQKVEVFNDGPTVSLALDNSKDLVFFDARSSELKTYSFKTGKILSAKYLDSIQKPFGVNGILIDKSNNTWLSVDKSTVLLYEAKTGTLHTIKHYNELSHSVAGDYFLSAMQDSGGTVFLGTVNGISYLNPEQNFISVVHFPDSVSHSRRYYLHQLLNCDKQNNIWFAPSYEYLLKYNPVKHSFKRYNILPPAMLELNKGIAISTMEADSHKLYFGTIDGIYIYDVASDSFGKLKQMPDSEKIDGKYILSMALTRDNELWFTSHHNGVFRYNTISGNYSHYLNDPSDATSFTNEYIYDLLEDKQGNIWFCAERDGIIKFNRTKNSFDYFTRDTSLADAEIFYAFACDMENNLWVQGFLTGLNKFDTKSNELIPVHFPGLFNSQYNHLFIDNSNRIWMAYYSQYSVLDLNTGGVKNFEVDFARINNDYANYSCQMTDGRMVSESRNSFFIFDPLYYEDRNPIETITISGFSVGQSVSPFVFSDSIIRLKAKQNFFSINFSTLSLLNNKDIQFAYKLEGIDEDWIYCGNRQTAYFTNLNGGDYVFRVKARSPNSEWKEASSPIRISINKVFYATVWFRLFLLAALAACVIWYIRLLKRRNLKRESDKAISYFANSLQGKNKVEELLWDITHNVITRTNLVDCVVYLLDEKKKVLVQKAAFGDKNPEEYKILNPIEIPLGQGIVGNVALSRKSEIVSDTSKDSRYIADDSSRLSEIAVPIIAEKRVIGVIDSEHPKKNFFTKEHLALLETIASITATKIIKAQREQEVILHEEHLEDLKQQVTRTRQQALQAQMNPHFIFNCLNSINGFILQNDAATASTFLIKFSKLIRLILEHSNEKAVSLQSELDALKLYIEMESLRFEKKFSYKINVDENIYADSVKVPPLILQPFVENSIWHGLLHKETEGKLQISVTQNNGSLEFIIEDNGIGREMSSAYKSKTPTHKKSLGLKLTKERIRLLNNNEQNGESYVKIVDLKNESGTAAGTRVIISIPDNSELN